MPSGALACGEMEQLIRDKDWSRTSLGPRVKWSQSLRGAISLMLASPVPMTLLWGPDGVMIYNDSYAASGAGRHPDMLGQKVREAWPEVAAFADNVMQVVLGGGRLSYQDQHLVLRRSGVDEDAWFNLDYSPVPDESGRPAGVIAIVIETTSRKRAEAALACSEQRWADLFNQMQEGFFIAEAVRDERGQMCDFRFLEANPAFRAISGVSDIVGRTLPEIFPGVDVAGIIAPYVDVVESGRSRHFESFVPSTIASGGGGRWFEIRTRALGDDRFAALAIDITAQKRATADLLKSESDFRTLAEAVPNHAWAASPDGALTWFNRRLYDYTGLNEGTLDGDNWAMIVHPADLQATAAAWARAITDVSLYEVEYRLRRADGSYRWFLARALPVISDDGRILRWIGTNTDVDDHKTAQAALLQMNVTLEQRVTVALAERRVWADIFELTEAPIAAIGLDFRFVALNKSHADKFEGVYGVRPKVGDNILDLLAHLPEDLAAARARWSRALAGEQFTVTAEMASGAKGRRSYQLTYNSLRDRSGRRVGAFQHALDVTEQLRDRARLVETEEQLRQAHKMEAVGQLTGGIAHDFNNILQGISGAMEMVRHRLAIGKLGGIDQFIDGAMQSAQRAADITQRLLAFSRRQSLDPKPTDINAHMLSIKELLGRTLGIGIDLQTRLAPDLWPAECDANQLESTMLNLAINARDAMPVSGKLIVETTNVILDTSPSPDCSGLAQGDYVVISVSDTGCGMAEEVIKRAFDPFFTTKPIGQGTGLGLSMIYGFAKQSRGHATIHSELGQGTTVKLYLPRSQRDVPVPVPVTAPLVAASEAQPAIRQEKVILVVEDEPAIRLLVSDLLQELGCQVMAVESGQKAIPILASDTPIDLMISDVGLPGMNGREVAEIGRGHRPNLPILFMTGFAENAFVRGDFLAPGMDMIAKPFALDALTARIRALLELA